MTDVTTIRPQAVEPSASKLEYAAEILLGEARRPWHSHPDDAGRLMLVADWLMLTAERARRTTHT